jgi:hypothetical protein
MTTQEADEQGWERAALRAQSLARDGKPDEAARLLEPLAAVGGSGGHMQEKALAWIEVGRAYVRACKDRDAETSLTEVSEVIEAMKEALRGK